MHRNASRRGRGATGVHGGNLRHKAESLTTMKIEDERFMLAKQSLRELLKGMVTCESVIRMLEASLAYASVKARIKKFSLEYFMP
jgi:hypothetical protein